MRAVCLTLASIVLTYSCVLDTSVSAISAQRTPTVVGADAGDD